ncbi:hypothetical protein BC827DRAFT_55126 [Russula dissimulans]|nr:hypothetical protein BC827DRAFT_55126 [Russula dissimulans]
MAFNLSYRVVHYTVWSIATIPQLIPGIIVRREFHSAGYLGTYRKSRKVYFVSSCPSCLSDQIRTTLLCVRKSPWNCGRCNMRNTSSLFNRYPLVGPHNQGQTQPFLRFSTTFETTSPCHVIWVTIVCSPVLFALGTMLQSTSTVSRRSMGVLRDHNEPPSLARMYV